MTTINGNGPNNKIQRTQKAASSDYSVHSAKEIMKEKDPHTIAMEAEESLEDFIQWQIDYEPTDNFEQYAEVTVSLSEMIKSSVLFYPRFVEIEGVIVLKSHFSDENWKSWREKLSPKDAANIINHIHIEHLFGHDPNQSKLEDLIGKLLSFYYQLAVKHQFPNHNVKVNFDGDVLHIVNE